jgi:hypothetical protein
MACDDLNSPLVLSDFIPRLWQRLLRHGIHARRILAIWSGPPAAPCRVAADHGSLRLAGRNLAARYWTSRRRRTRTVDAPRGGCQDQNQRQFLADVSRIELSTRSLSFMRRVSSSVTRESTSTRSAAVAAASKVLKLPADAATSTRDFPPLFFAVGAASSSLALIDLISKENSPAFLSASVNPIDLT